MFDSTINSNTEQIVVSDYTKQEMVEIKSEELDHMDGLSSVHDKGRDTEMSNEAHILEE